MDRVGVPIPVLVAMIALLLAATTHSTSAQTTEPADAPPCGFIDGFHTFREQAGADLVGDCLEHSRATAGGVEQRTTNGLLVWDKTLNLVAFTDGHRTWLSGPHGIETRTNTERLAWEEEALRAIEAEAKAEAAAGAAALSAPSPRDLALLYVERVRGNNAVSLEKIYLTALYQAQHALETRLAAARTAVTAWLSHALPARPLSAARASRG